MVDKIQKFLNKLPEKDKALIKQLLKEIQNKSIVGLDFKKLKGREDIYRVRKDKIRIIYRLLDDEILVLSVERRNDMTYRNL